MIFIKNKLQIHQILDFFIIFMLFFRVFLKKLLKFIRVCVTITLHYVEKEVEIMTKTELIAAMAEKTGASKKDSEAALSAAIEAITGALKAGDKVSLVGFGTFEAKKRAARVGKNPRTGEEIQIPATVAPTFKAGKALKDAIK